jgi:hypothetical protein
MKMLDEGIHQSINQKALKIPGDKKAKRTICHVLFSTETPYGRVTVYE